MAAPNLEHLRIRASKAFPPMAPRRPQASPKPPAERRTGDDRRRADKGPPRGRERRVTLEPRQPEVVELDITPEEWVELHQAASEKDADR